MKQKFLAATLIISIVVGITAICYREDILPIALLQAKEERDNKICQARSILANLSIDYLAALEQLKNTWEVNKYMRDNEQIRFACALIISEGGNDPNCTVRDPRELMHLKMQVVSTARALKSGQVRYQSQVNEIQREFLLSLGVSAPVYQKSQRPTKMPSCQGDEYIETAIKQLPSS